LEVGLELSHRRHIGDEHIRLVALPEDHVSNGWCARNILPVMIEMDRFPEVAFVELLYFRGSRNCSMASANASRTRNPLNAEGIH
jgi:hypothetical protein